MEKQILITGGTKGIGKAVAVCLAKAGYALILTYASDLSTAEITAEDLRREYNVPVLLLQADITSPDSINTIDAFLESHQITLYSVLFNAGLTCRDSFEDLTPEAWERVFYANVHFQIGRAHV